MSRTLALNLSHSHRSLAERALSREQFSLARRHYRLALRIAPECAVSRMGLARAWEDDPQGSDEIAYRHYRRAVRADRDDALALAHLGRAAGRVGREKLAKTALAKAMKLAPTDTNVLGIVLEAHREAGRLKRSLKLATAARFRQPRSEVVRRHWLRCRYDVTASDRQTLKYGDASATLPFLRIHDGWRLDTPKESKPHLN